MVSKWTNVSSEGPCQIDKLFTCVSDIFSYLPKAYDKINHKIADGEASREPTFSQI